MAAAISRAMASPGREQAERDALAFGPLRCAPPDFPALVVDISPRHPYYSVETVGVRKWSALYLVAALCGRNRHCPARCRRSRPSTLALLTVNYCPAGVETRSKKGKILYLYHFEMSALLPDKPKADPTARVTGSPSYHQKSRRLAQLLYGGPGEGRARTAPARFTASTRRARPMKVMPLYEHYRRSRTVYAPELPASGFSERGDRDYSPRMMTDAVHAMIAEIQQIHGSAARCVGDFAGAEFWCGRRWKTESVRSLAPWISPTGFNRKTPEEAPPAVRAPCQHFVKSCRGGQIFFRAADQQGQYSLFPEKTWGSKNRPRLWWNTTTSRRISRARIRAVRVRLGFSVQSGHSIHLSRAPHADMDGPRRARRFHGLHQGAVIRLAAELECRNFSDRSDAAFRNARPGDAILRCVSSGVAQRMARSISPEPSAIR